MKNNAIMFLADYACSAGCSVADWMRANRIHLHEWDWLDCHILSLPAYCVNDFKKYFDL